MNSLEKPQSMSLKEWLIKKLSLQLLIPEKVIDLVISEQFTEAFRSTTTHNSIEISGFGKIVFNQKKAHAQMEKYLSQKQMYETLITTAATLEAKQNATWKLNTVLRNIEHLKPKLRHEPKANIRGVEKPSDPFIQSEANNNPGLE